MKGIYAALTTLVVTLIVALFVFELPARVSAGAITEGVVAGIFPIGYIVLMAVWLYKVSIKTGQFSIIQDSIASISEGPKNPTIINWILFQRIFRRCSRIWCANCGLCSIINSTWI